jgi:hypothetical protein
MSDRDARETGSDAASPAPLPAADRTEVAHARLQLLSQAQRRVTIYQPALADDVYGTAPELAELRRIATSGRGAEIRLILHAPEDALRDNHRLVALAQRLSSIVLVRTPLEDVDLAYASSYLLSDLGGYLFQPDAKRPDGRASFADRAAQAPLMQHFNEVWERSARATAWQPLDL